MLKIACILARNIGIGHLVFLGILITYSATVAWAFCPRWHNHLIAESFGAEEVERVNAYAELQSAKDESANVDQLEFKDPERHSMRPQRTDLTFAQAKTADYLKTWMDAAVTAAKNKRKDEAGRALGRVLHAIQDGKHQWVSCGPDSNGTDSANTCSESPTGCTEEGVGNHGLDLFCFVPRELVRNPLRIPCWSGRIKNFQMHTDMDPTLKQLGDALENGKRKLAEFLSLVPKN